MIGRLTGDDIVDAANARLTPNTPNERRAATLTVCANAHDAADAHQLLRALGLEDDPRPSVVPKHQRWRP